MKASAIAPSNIAFIKYWGKSDENLRLPANNSLSMNLSNLSTVTTVEFSPIYKNDTVTIDGFVEPLEKAEKIMKHLDKIRIKAKISEKAKVVTKNNFPRGTGLSSSASGFAALTVAGAKAAGLKLSEKELSILARSGSGSACRSIPDGFVEWKKGKEDNSSYAVSIFPADYWNIVDLVVIITSEVKDVSTSDGQEFAPSSPFYKTRLNNMQKRIKDLKMVMEDKNFDRFGEIVEAEALELHAIMLTSRPSLIYWYPSTIAIMKYVKKLRSEGIPVFFTLNTGQNIHLITLKKYYRIIQNKLTKISSIEKIIMNEAANGARLSREHLF